MRPVLRWDSKIATAKPFVKPMNGWGIVEKQGIILNPSPERDLQ
jgi:hypothetical protein